MNKVPLECKHVSAFQKEEEIYERYFPQVQGQMLLTGAKKAYLSVIFGTQKYKYWEIEADPIYQAMLAETARKFMECVKSGEPPVIQKISVPVEATKKIDMTGSNEWANHADIWLKNHGYAKAFDASAKAIKELVEADAVEAFGHGIKATRAKTGAITIRKEK